MITTIKDWKGINEGMLDDDPSFDKSLAKNFFNELFTWRQIAHDFHLKSELAYHLALGSFYESLLELVDEMVETCQGKHGLLDLKTNISYDCDDIIAYLEESVPKLQKTSLELFDQSDSFLLNVFDEILGLTYRTLYKLKYL